MSDRIKIKYWWDADKKWFCIIANDGVNEATISLTPEEASLLSMNAVIDEPAATPAVGGEPVAWICDLANNIDNTRNYGGWQPHLSRTRPNVPERSIRNLQPLYLAPQSSPTAWRWRAPGAANWIYDPTPEWRLEHQDSIETQPLYAAPPASPLRGITDEMVSLACEVYAEVYCDDDKDMGDAMRAALKATVAPASPLRGGDITDEMLNAHLKATDEWVDPYEAATECGVPIECGITQDDADELNTQSRASLRVGYAAAFASPPEQPAADPDKETPQ